METVQYKCPYCGGELKLNPDTGSFSCEYCQSDFDEQQMQALYGDQNEQAMQQADPEVDTLQDDQEAADFAAHTKLYECPSCGRRSLQKIPHRRRFAITAILRLFWLDGCPEITALPR